jgi:hypothetical protein
MSTFTRRQAMVIVASLPAAAWGFAAKEFWDAKPPAQWTTDERKRLLEDSPWARAASISVYGEPGSVRPRNPNRFNGTPMTLPRETSSAQPQFGATVRWLSAAPLRSAFTALGEHERPDFAQSYVLQVAGNIPGLGGTGKEDADDDLTREGTVEMLKQYTRLEHKRGPVFLESIEAGPPGHPGALFFFSRAEEIKLPDRQVNFTTKMGPLEIKARFTLSEMLYGGKLAL